MQSSLSRAESFNILAASKIRLVFLFSCILLLPISAQAGSWQITTSFAGTASYSSGANVDLSTTAGSVSLTGGSAAVLTISLSPHLDGQTVQENSGGAAINFLFT